MDLDCSLVPKMKNHPGYIADPSVTRNVNTLRRKQKRTSS